jgi:pyridoxamine 5'-phosphate oxidase
MPRDDSADPVTLFRAWYEEACAKEPADPDAMALATVGSDGRPSARMVLLRGFDERGFVFYTNCESRKGRELLACPHAALCIHWKSTSRQVRVEGPAEPVSAEEADAYFASRPRSSQIGAWASTQSRPLTGRHELERRIAEYPIRFGLGAVARPPHWSGFRVVPTTIEFWEQRPFRLHDRLVYHRRDGAWATERLFP